MVTSEIRWFNEGAVPVEMMWFVTDSALGAHEERRDLYRLDGRLDVGVKLRARALLELKRRRSSVWGHPAAGGPGGLVEVWHKWSPADGLVDPALAGRWIEVHKRIFRRRFSVDGAEMELVDHSAPRAGCDVEIVALGVEGLEAWSFAFAAHGPQRTHRASIASAWRALARGPAPARTLVAAMQDSCGYPEYLERHFGDITTGSRSES